MALWKKLWLLFAAIWIIVAALQAGTILAFSDEHEKALRPIAFGVAVPALLYGVGWLWEVISRWRRLPPREK